ncbi:kinetochore protein Nuf2-B-like [Octopus vulgaris]|uniref:Kinetochore protein Nuf2-B-like n=1 Tax=Octopus vulgaris TaxID=6645 RepID=A0AA36FLE5_OCTVU|nr:kinetochore protein Nuf2-B-like [Octopus vulgaris]
MSQFFFPLLKLEEILENWDFVKRSDYEKPEAIRWFRIYALLFESITGVKLDSVEEKALLTFNKIIDVEHPEIYDEAGRVIWFTIALQRAFIACGVHDFTFKDVRDPRPKRLIVISSACINLLRFKSSREPLIQEILENIETKKMQYNEFIKNNEECRRKLEIARQIQEKKEPEKESLMKDSEEMKEKLSAIQAESEEILAAIAERKAKIAEIRALKAQTNCESVKLKQEKEKLQQNIVQSPEKTKEKRKSMKEKVEKMKEEIQRKVSTLSNYSSKLSSMTNSEHMQEQILHLLQTMEEDMQKHEKIKNEIKAFMELSVVNSMKLKSFQLEERELVDAQALIQERHENLQTQKRVRLRDLDARSSAQAEQNKNLREALQKAIQRREEKLKERQLLMDTLKDSASNSTKTINTVIKNYSDILQELDKYHLLLKKNLVVD